MTSAQVDGFSPASLRRYGPRARSWFARAQTERVPLAGGIELTHRCNLACVHCYVNLPAADREAARREMTTDEVCRLVDQLAEAGTLKLTLTGGEPLLRADFADIYRHVHRRGILPVVYTNAALITERICALWRAHPPAKVEVTQYGHSPRVYDDVAAAGEGAHRKFRRGLALLERSGVRFALKTIALRGNAHEIAAMKRHAESLGVEFRFDAVVTPRIDGGRGPLAHRLPPDEVAGLEVGLSGAQQWADYCTAQLDGADPADDRAYQCGAGHATFLIDPYGRLHVCELSRRPGFDVVRGGFSRGWYEAVPALLAQPRAEAGGCDRCDASPVCSTCTGLAELDGKVASQPDVYQCQVTDERLRRSLGPGRPQPAGLVQLRRRSA